MDEKQTVIKENEGQEHFENEQTNMHGTNASGVEGDENRVIDLGADENTQLKVKNSTERNSDENNYSNNANEEIENNNTQSVRDVFDNASGEKGFALMMGNDEAALVDYFSKLGIQKDEILREKRAFVDKVRTKLFADDLAELQNEFSFITANSIREIPNYEKFAKLRASGLSAIESFEGASGKLISMEFLKSRDDGSYSHLRSSGLKGSTAGDIPIPKEQIGIWKSAFPNDGFAQLTKRYNRTKYQKGEYINV